MVILFRHSTSCQIIQRLMLMLVICSRVVLILGLLITLIQL
nr:MAG TPA: hypothetical protein [Caudoviricetes sp.]